MGYPKLLAFVGKSGSGKTTLVEKLIAKLSEAGLKVGAVKRSHHKVDIDREGKDSWRFRNAGANPTILASDTFMGYMERIEKPLDMNLIARQFEGKADIVLIEGFKSEVIPRFLVVTPAGVQDEEIDNVAGFIITEATQESLKSYGKPVFYRNDIAPITEWIIDYTDGR